MNTNENQNENKTTPAENIPEISSQTEKIIAELLASHPQKKGSFFVIGCSTSEVAGGSIGKDSSAEIGKAIFTAAERILTEKGIFLACQCCEHLNRALVVERECAEKYGLDESIPFVSTGGSMGGLACIVYTKYAKRTPVGCVANCPVCDLPSHYTERVDLPRTLYSAFYSYDCSLDEALKSCSPLHMIPTLPKETGYIIFHCEKDSAVNIGMHSDKFVSELSKTREVVYYTVPERDHCDLGAEMHAKYKECVLSFIK